MSGKWNIEVNDVRLTHEIDVEIYDENDSNEGALIYKYIHHDYYLLFHSFLII